MKRFLTALLLTLSILSIPAFPALAFQDNDITREGYYKTLKLVDQGNCTMSSGACSAQALTKLYNAAPVCFCTFNGTGTLTGIVSCPSTTSTVTPASSVNTDTAHINWICFGQ